MGDPTFRVFPGDPASSVIVHVPHSSRTVPADVRARIVLTDKQLEHELDRMTDSYTADIAAVAVTASTGQRPWVFLNEQSRLVVDPERFPDERESMRQVGMGAVYTRTHDGNVLRQDDPEHERQLLDTYFFPYAQALTNLVADRLATTGRAVIIDLHSFPTARLPYEIGDEHRPPLCIGTDPLHTPPSLEAAVVDAFRLDTTINSPFSGCYVPLEYYGVDSRVESVMIELRRDQYLDETTMAKDPSAVTALGNSLTKLVEAVDHPSQ